jgi:DNA-directed RNA polymerase specialized sigma24 family protein
MADGERTVTHWIGELKAGDAGAAGPLWDRYAEALVRLAREKLGAAPRATADEEDVALSAFHSLCAGAAQGQFPELDDRHDLWRLLVTITVRKAIDHEQHQRRLKRGGGRVRDDDGLDRLADPGPTPELAAILSEALDRLFTALRDDTLRRIARLQLEGHTGDEIAALLSCNRRTVVRKLELIRATWLGLEAT